MDKSIFQKYKDLVLKHLCPQMDVRHSISTSIIDEALELGLTSGASQEFIGRVSITIHFKVTGLTYLSLPIEGQYTFYCASNVWSAFQYTVDQLMNEVSFGKPSVLGVRDIDHTLIGYHAKFCDFIYTEDCISLIRQGKHLVTVPFLK